MRVGAPTVKSSFINIIVKRMAPRRNYTPEQMGKAIEAVRNGMKIAVAAKSFGVPRITLYNKVAGKTPINCTMGPDSVLSKEQEAILARWVIALSEKHFPITKLCLQDSVQKIIMELNLPNPFNNNRPGKKWCKSFLKRHPELVEKVPENLTKARDNVSEKDIKNWFQEIDTYLKENNLEEVVKDPNRVFNTDESAFFLSPKPGRVLAKKGEKHLYTVCGDEKDNLTVLFTGNASGLLAPPMIVFNYERIPSHIAASVPEDWAIGKSESGWMCSSTFYEYITNVFNPWLEDKNIEKPILFFLDGHKSHLTLHLSNFCAQNGIELIALYPNSTHLLQPMDLAVFRPLKVFWKQSVNDWRLENLGQNIKKETFAPVLQKAVSKLTEDCVKNGFRAGGLCPFGPEYIDMTKLKHREEKEPFKPNTELTTFVKYLENEIVKVFSVEKLNLFNQLFYKNRNTVDQCLPEEDTALYVIWAKNKSECGSYNPPIEPEIVNNQSNSQLTVPTTLVRISSSSVNGNDELFRSPLQNGSETSAPVVHTEVSNSEPTAPTTPVPISSPSVIENDELFRSPPQTVSETVSAPVVPTEVSSSEPTAPTTPVPIGSSSAVGNDELFCSQPQNVSETVSAPVERTELSNSEPTAPTTAVPISSSSVIENDERFRSPPQTVSETVSAPVVPTEVSSSEPTAPTTPVPIDNSSAVGSDELFCSQPQNVSETVSARVVPTEVSLDESIAIPGPSKLVTPQKQSIDAALGIIVPSPFKRNLFWPGTDNSKKTKRIKREKIPSAVTSKAWRDYHEKKEMEKKKQEEEKAERAKNRQEKKILKEKTAEEKKKKCNSKSVTKKLTLEERNTKDSNSEDEENQKKLKQKITKKERSKSDLKLKRKKVFFEDSSSEDSDIVINFAESGDSCEEEIDEDDYLSEEETRKDLPLNKKNKQKGNTKGQQRNPKRKITHSRKDTSDSDVDVPFNKLNLPVNKKIKQNGNTKWQQRHPKRTRTHSLEHTSDSDVDVPLNKVTTSRTLTRPKKINSSGCYVIVMYEGEYFPGRIENVNENQYEVSTMTLSMGNSFRWPDKPDKIWYKEDQIIEKIDEPVSINKRGFFKVKEMEKYLPDILYT